MNSFTGRQKEIIDMSIKIIAEKGIQQLTIKNISKSIGISEPAIYRHFKRKMDILLAILSHFKKNRQIIAEKITSREMSSIMQIESLFIDHFKQFSANPALAAVIFSEEIFQNDKRLSEQVSLIMQLNQKMILNIIKAGQQSHEIRNDISEKQLSIIIMGALRLIVSKWRLSNFSFDLETEGIGLWESLKKLIEFN
ncbi:TetR/AcrR family transcriptional regulator [candidate division KSB1 bacterium]|nr:TetR/AcrR family transcriptional regulator [candidate division KSB1 bacterium]